MRLRVLALLETRAKDDSFTDRRQPSSPGDVLDRVLDKGIVVDHRVDISLGGIELITLNAHIVVVSIETYLDHGSGWPSSEAVTRAAEEYLRRLGPDGRPER